MIQELDARFEEIEFGCSTTDTDVGTGVILSATSTSTFEKKVSEDPPIDANDIREALSGLVGQNTSVVGSSAVQRRGRTCSGRIRLIDQSTDIARIVGAV